LDFVSSGCHNNLRLKALRKKSYIRVNTKELNRVLSIKYLPYIH